MSDNHCTYTLFIMEKSQQALAFQPVQITHRACRRWKYSPRRPWERCKSIWASVNWGKIIIKIIFNTLLFFSFVSHEWGSTDTNCWKLVKRFKRMMIDEIQSKIYFQIYLFIEFGKIGWCFWRNNHFTNARILTIWNDSKPCNNQ